MTKELIVSSTSLETKLAILEDDQVAEILIEREKNRGILGNIYKGKVTKVLPGMQAAFVDIGFERHAFLYVDDFFEGYEEYEELFPERLETERLIARDQPSESSEKKKRKTPQRRRKGPQLTLKPAASQVRTSAPKVAPVVPPELFPLTPDERILPETLDLAGDVPAEADEIEAGLNDRVGGNGILPAVLDSIMERELEAAKSKKSKRQAEVRLKPEVVPFAVRPRSKKSETQTKSRKKKNGNNGSAQIGDLLKAGQEILVQVAKEPIGKKGARITSHIALPGRHLVFMPTVDHVGVSRKISSEKERARLRECVLEFRGDGGKGFIVRTAGEGQTKEAITADMAYLTRLWEGIRTKAEKKSGPALVHAEPGLVERLLRDRFSDEFRAIRVDDEEEYERIVEFVNTLAPELIQRVRLHSGRKHIFESFGVNPEIEKALKHKVWLKNGGHIVINQTEALVAIDVNTGRFVGKTNSLEDTITKTNLDAVREVVRQIRLRDLGGIIIIDFIDMDESKNRRRVMEALQKELSKDKSPSKILRFNEFGLVALTRKRVKQSLEKVLCQPCSCCSGTGMTKSTRTTAYSIHQEVSRLVPHMGTLPELLIRCHPEVAKALAENDRDVIKEIRLMTRKIITVKPDSLMHIEQFDLVET